MPVDDLTELLGDAIAPLEDRLTSLHRDRAHLVREYAEQRKATDSQIRRVESILRTIKGEPRKTKAASKSNHWSVSDARMADARAWIKSLARDKEFTVAEMEDALSWAPETCRRAIAKLRETHELRLIGMNNNRAFLYRPM